MRNVLLANTKLRCSKFRNIFINNLKTCINFYLFIYLCKSLLIVNYLRFTSKFLHITITVDLNEMKF